MTAYRRTMKNLGWKNTLAVYTTPEHIRSKAGYFRDIQHNHPGLTPVVYLFVDLSGGYDRAARDIVEAETLIPADCALRNIEVYRPFTPVEVEKGWVATSRDIFDFTTYICGEPAIFIYPSLEKAVASFHAVLSKSSEIPIDYPIIYDV